MCETWKTSPRQEDRAIALLQERGMMRLSEFIKEGITSATISRMEQKGLLNQLSRGLYQLPDAPLDANHSLAVAAKLVPNGVVCHNSALAFHELTDRIPPFVWMAIGPRDWRPTITQPRIQIMRFGPKVFDKGIRALHDGAHPRSLFIRRRKPSSISSRAPRIKRLSIIPRPVLPMRRRA